MRAAPHLRLVHSVPRALPASDSPSLIERFGLPIAIAFSLALWAVAGWLLAGWWWP